MTSLKYGAKDVRNVNISCRCYLSYSQKASSMKKIGETNKLLLCKFFPFFFCFDFFSILLLLLLFCFVFNLWFFACLIVFGVFYFSLNTSGRKIQWVIYDISQKPHSHLITFSPCPLLVLFDYFKFFGSFVGNTLCRS